MNAGGQFLCIITLVLFGTQPRHPHLKWQRFYVLGSDIIRNGFNA
jgi:hypothetical protein